MSGIDRIFRPAEPPRRATQVISPRVLQLDQEAPRQTLNDAARMPPPPIPDQAKPKPPAKTEPNPPDPNSWNSCKCLLSCRTNKVGFDGDQVAICIKAALTTTAIKNQEEFQVIPQSYTGPYVIVSNVHIYDFLVGLEEFMVNSEEGQTLFNVLECDKFGNPFRPPPTAEALLDAKEQVLIRRSQERERTLVFFIAHPIEIAGTKIAESEETAAAIEAAFTKAVRNCAERVAVVRSETTKLGFRASQHMVYVTLPQLPYTPANPTQLDPITGASFEWPKLVPLPGASSPGLVTMPRPQLAKLGIKHCCFRPVCALRGGVCQTKIALRQARRPENFARDISQAREERKRKQDEARLDSERAMKERMVQVPCNFLNKGCCVRGFSLDPADKCLYLHPDRDFIAKIPCTSAETRPKPKPCQFGSAAACPYAGHRDARPDRVP